MTYAQMDDYLIPDLVLAEQEGQQIGKYRCRISGCHGVIRHILCHDRTGCHDGILTDCYPGKDRRIRSDPCATLDVDRFAEQYLPIIRIVVVGDQRNIRRDQYIVFDRDAAGGHHQAVVLDHNIVSDPNRLGENAAKRRIDHHIFPHAPAEQLPHDSQ